MNARLALFIALFASAAHADSSPYMKVCADNLVFDSQGAMPLIAIAFSLVSFAIALAYMYGKTREDEKATVWAKDEAYNLVISVMLFVGLLAFFAGSCAVAETYAGGNPFSVSRNYIDTLLQDNGLSTLRSLTYGSISDQKQATSYLYTGMTPFFGSGVSDYANYRALSAQKEFLIDTYLPIIASLTAQKYMLQAIGWIAASVLLPFGFIMRLVPPTRDFGNTLIALFFALYIIVPTTYAMSGAVFMDKITNAPFACVDCGVNTFSTFGLATPGPVQSQLLYKMASAIPQAVFIPNLVIIIAITCTMALSKALRAITV
ncbi:Uncharacterised protein [uncultured archaeon]|nr:Uncharacterised protein [uncultured archaeon]